MSKQLVVVLPTHDKAVFRNASEMRNALADVLLVCEAVKSRLLSAVNSMSMSRTEGLDDEQYAKAMLKIEQELAAMDRYIDDNVTAPYYQRQQV